MNLDDFMKIIPMQSCPLCKNKAVLFNEDQFYQCGSCKSIFRSKDFHLSFEQEKQRYMEHNNYVHDAGYRKFVTSITSEILATFGTNHCGLDFGAGPGPVISKILQERNYNIVQYDPFFYSDHKLLDVTYDYIACCEVIEHFRHPMREFLLLKRLLKPDGRLYCMTHFYNQQNDFKNWYYKNDPSHVFFYSEDTLKWIAHTCQYSIVTIRNRLAILKND